MTKSGLWLVRIMSGGIFQDCWRRSEIICMSVELISFLMNVSIDDSTLSCLQVFLPCSSMYGHELSAWLKYSALPHNVHALASLLPHLVRLSFVGKVFSWEFSINLSVPCGRLKMAAFQNMSEDSLSNIREYSPCITRLWGWSFYCIWKVLWILPLQLSSGLPC